VAESTVSRPRVVTRRRVVAVVAVALAVVVGVRLAAPQSIGDPVARPTAGEAASSGLDPTMPPPLDLSALVVDLTAAPSDWRDLPIAPPGGAPLCPVADAAMIPATGSAAVSFTDPTGTAVLAEKVSSYADGDAARVLASIAAKAPTCVTFSADGAVYALTELTAPALGDEAVAFQVMSEGTGPHGVERMFADVVYVRSGDMVITMSHLTAGNANVAGTEDFVVACLTKAGVIIA
jgi:hypothetical protein